MKLRDLPPAGTAALGFRAAAKPAAMDEHVFTIGYPLSRMLGNNARMTRGLLSATTGLRDDDKQLQVSAKIQPGNSGGQGRDNVVSNEEVVIKDTLDQFRKAVNSC